MSDDRWIVIPRWEEFQHPDVGRTGNILWVRNYTRLLSDDAYLGLTAHQRGVLHGLWLEYARSRCQLHASTRSLSRRLSLRVSAVQLQALVDAGFVSVSATKPAVPASSLQAERKQPASLEEKRREEVRSTSVSSLQTNAVEQAASRRRPAKAADAGKQPPGEDPHKALLTRARSYAETWEGTSSLAFDEHLDDLEQEYGVPFRSLERQELWDRAYAHNKSRWGGGRNGGEPEDVDEYF